MSEEKRTNGGARYLAMVACVLLGGFVYVGWRIKKGDELQKQLMLTAGVQDTNPANQGLNIEVPQNNRNLLHEDAASLNDPATASDPIEDITIGSDNSTNYFTEESADIDIESLLASVPSPEETPSQNNAIGGVAGNSNADILIPQAEQLPPTPLNTQSAPSIDTYSAPVTNSSSTESTIPHASNFAEIEKERNTAELSQPVSANSGSLLSHTHYQNYRVRKGDTLSKIAQKFLGSRKGAKDIFTANRSILSSPDRLRVGMNIRIPTNINPQRTSMHIISTTDSLPSIAMRYYGSAEPEMIEGIRLANPILSQGGFREGTRLSIPPISVVRQTPVDVFAQTPAGTEKVYTVRSGDTLSKIAARKYGDGNKWRFIFNANKDKISKPSAIRVGMQLRLP